MTPPAHPASSVSSILGTLDRQTTGTAPTSESKPRLVFSSLPTPLVTPTNLPTVLPSAEVERPAPPAAEPEMPGLASSATPNEGPAETQPGMLAAGTLS